MDSQAFVRYALAIGAIELVPGGRKLKSGRMSPYFFNSGLFKNGDTIFKLAMAYVPQFEHLPNATCLFGPAYKGIPLAVAVSIALPEEGRIVGYAFNRKEEKDHGEGGVIVGDNPKDQPVIVVDDVMTTGTSSGEAVDIVRRAGGLPVGAAIAFDRQERGVESALSATQEFTQKYGIPVRAAATLADLIAVLREFPEIHAKARDTLSAILAYKEEYGVA